MPEMMNAKKTETPENPTPKSGQMVVSKGLNKEVSTQGTKKIRTKYQEVVAHPRIISKQLGGDIEDRQADHVL